MTRREFIAALAGTAVAVGLAPAVVVAEPPSLFFGLHDAIGVEVAYGGYRRVAVPCSPEGWLVEKYLARLTAPVMFPQCLDGEAVATHAWLYDAEGRVLYRSPLDRPLRIESNVTASVRFEIAFDE